MTPDEYQDARVYEVGDTAFINGNVYIMVSPGEFRQIKFPNDIGDAAREIRATREKNDKLKESLTDFKNYDKNLI
jgi:hypothetical protein